jgi:ATP-dependent Clp protease adaptor protein ClpS
MTVSSPGLHAEVPGGPSCQEARPPLDPTMMTMSTAPAEVERPEVETTPDRPWVTIVWDDPVNLMEYVTHVFQKLFGYPKPKAQRLMLQVHNEGRAAVSAGTREQMENDVQRLHAAGLWATLQKDE